MASAENLESATRFSQFSFPRVCFSLLLLSFLSIPAFGGFLPSFGLDHCAWSATDIVLADITAQDDDFQVVESWKGALKTGDHITIPQLQPAPSAIPISLYSKQSRPYRPSSKGNIEDIPRQPVGSRVVLFLRKDGEIERAQNSLPNAEQPKWQPADSFQEISTSVIWVDGTQLYVFTQETNPGPSLLLDWNKSLADVHARVTEIVQIQRALTEAVRVKDEKERAELLKPYVRSDVFPAKIFALEELGKCGPAALGTIRTMLDEPEYSLQAEDLIKAYAEAGGESASEELNNRLLWLRLPTKHPEDR